MAQPSDVSDPSVADVDDQMFPQGVGSFDLQHVQHVRFVDLESFGYTVVDVTREEVRAESWFVDPEDVDARRRPGAARVVR